MYNGALIPHRVEIPPMMNVRTSVSDHPGGMDDDTLAAAVATLAATYSSLPPTVCSNIIAELDRRKLWTAQGARRKWGQSGFSGAVARAG